ncbi:secreted protein containing DUF1552 [Rhodopirellula maiorica SM1]|uniref:Secreted protein containing DUF1552 n=2 Tax=Novipirellula TaxID=2795426 RepID=M5RUG2_9BACT|nr:secreted protein containing DUF1552 [Rhodopirellula maiorica SM1]
MLRGTGIAMGLPWLSAMQPTFASDRSESKPKRLVTMTLGLGLVADNLFPEAGGRDYQATPYLRPLQDLRNQFTVVSGTSHPGVKGGHRAEASILTATPMGSAGKAKNSISIDQLLAKHFGDATRFPSLVLSNGGSTSPSYTENGSMIPPESSPSRLFAKLFINDPPQQRKIQAQRVHEGRSIMDLVGEDVKSLERQLGVGDRNRLDAYFTSVRQLEKRMELSERWAKLPKPDVDAKKPVDVGNPNDLIARQKTMCEVIKLALQTDSTRYISFHVPGSGGVLPLEGVDEGYHSLSHHGQDEDKLSQLAIVEEAFVDQWGQFLRDLKETDDSGASLLDLTTVFLTSNLGNASNHDNRNMPVLLAGGGFRHGQHLAFDRKNNYPLPNLYVSMLQNLGMEIDQFATSTGTMNGLSS